MHDAVAALLDRRSTIDTPTWRSFWDQLSDGGLGRGDTVALLASLATQLPDHDTLRSLLASLDERRPAVTERFAGAVNIVGTGGGPPTFNVSTAAAIVAAAVGVPVVKTGSRAHASSCGSIDLLERLGVGLTKSYDQTGESLDRFGVAFAGYFVYPTELTLLAKSIVPASMKPFGRFLNALGPFLAAVPVSAQVTGVSDRGLLPALRRLADTVGDRTIWLCANDQGADELLGFAENVVHANDRVGAREHVLAPGQLTTAGGGIEDLRPAPGGSVVEHFCQVLAGEAGRVATETVCLNAAALAITGRHIATWTTAMAAALDAVRTGAALDLLERLRSQPRPRRGIVVSGLTKATVDG
jgi:anthranilate phosphoribosyltransferase